MTQVLIGVFFCSVQKLVARGRTRVERFEYKPERKSDRTQEPTARCGGG
jgi:hypothetical protein